MNFHPKIAFGFSDKGLPLSEKFSLGGKNSFFGLYSEELKGDKMILLNLGFRVNFLKRFYLTLRYDWGDAWTRLREIKWEKVEQGVGVGLSLATPLGPIEFYYGKAKGKKEKIYMQAGLELVKRYAPLAKENEPYEWGSETTVAPWVIYVLKELSQH